MENSFTNKGNQEDLYDSNWQLINISNVDDKIIKRLLNKLKLGISDDFFLSFESLIKIGKKGKKEIVSIMKENDLDPFVKEILFFLLKLIDNKEIQKPLLYRLFNPDFIMRARTIMEINDRGIEKYFKYVIPLIDDPDDSCRWAALQLLISHGLIEKNPIIKHHLKEHLKLEKNQVIKDKIREIIQ
ncbi:MAG: HEAT repeat domain-containing protein [Promethearchaeota archaeon]|nr:MAG: HEAT repeat domain-containing protein [Candidatus Lokiarchaeota archaeon]